MTLGIFEPSDIEMRQKRTEKASSYGRQDGGP